MAAEGMRVDAEDVLVTTGGQQVIDLVTKTLIDPGDVVVAEGPTYPGAVPVFTAYQADVVQIDMDSDGMRIDLLEETLDRLEREGRRPKFIYTVPSFQNPAGVTMSQPRRKRLVEVAHERELLVLEDNPYGLLRYEGEPPPPLLLARRRRVRDVPRHVLEDPLAGHPARLGRGAAAGAREDQPRQAGGRPLHLDALAADGPGVLRGGPLARLRGVAHRDLPRAAATRCSTRSPTTSRPRPSGRGPPAGCSSGRRCPTSSTRPTCSPARCARTSRSCPGEAAFLDGRGRNSMRLNFSGLGRGRDPRGHPPDRRGGHRAGAALRHAHRRDRGGRATGRAAAGAEEPLPRGADILQMPDRAERARRPAPSSLPRRSRSPRA